MSAFLLGFVFSAAPLMAAPVDFLAGREPSPLVRIASSALVEGDVVTLGSVARIEGGKESDREALSRITLAQIPASASAYRVPGAYIQQRIRETMGPDRRVAIEVPNFVEFNRKQKIITNLDLREYAAAKIRERFDPPSDVHVEVTLESALDPIAVDQSADVQFDLLGVPPQGSGRTTLKLNMTEKNGKELRQIVVPMRVSWQAVRWVAKRNLSNRLPVTAADFERRTVSLGAREGEAIDAADEKELAILLEGARLRRSLNEGMLLTKPTLYRDPDVNRGQKLRVVIRSDSGLEIQTSGEALLSGSVGSPLRVRLEKTGRVVSGQLVAKDLVEMHL